MVRHFLHLLKPSEYLFKINNRKPSRRNMPVEKLPLVSPSKKGMSHSNDSSRDSTPRIYEGY